MLCNAAKAELLLIAVAIVVLGLRALLVCYCGAPPVDYWYIVSCNPPLIVLLCGFAYAAVREIARRIGGAECV